MTVFLGLVSIVSLVEVELRRSVDVILRVLRRANVIRVLRGTVRVMVPRWTATAIALR
jgi:hypothetical protein